MRETDRYNLQLPEADDYVDVETLDGNFETIDEALGRLSDDMDGLKPPLQTDLEEDAQLADKDYITVYKAKEQIMRRVPLERVLGWIKEKLNNVFAPYSHAQRHKKGGADAIAPADIGAEAAHISVKAALLTSGWIGAGPYTQEIAVTGISATRDGVVGLSPGRTEEQHLEAASCMLMATSARSGYLTITALKKKPTVNIPVSVTMLTGGTGQLISCFPGGGAEDAAAYLAQDTAPVNKGVLWIDTLHGGIPKYHNGIEWIPTKAVWG